MPAESEHQLFIVPSDGILIKLTFTALCSLFRSSSSEGLLLEEPADVAVEGRALLFIIEK